MKNFNKIFFPCYQKFLLIISILIFTLSIIAFIYTFLEGCQMTFDFTSSGFQNYLKLFKPYWDLFSSMVVVITGYLAVTQLRLMYESNRTSFKVSNRTIWIQTVKDFMIEMKVNNPFMFKDVYKKLINIHDYLFEKNYKISDKIKAEEFFKSFFLNEIENYEKNNIDYEKHIGYYNNDNHSYSYEEFKNLIRVMIDCDASYERFLQDMREMYQIEVLKSSVNYINSKEYYKKANNIIY